MEDLGTEHLVLAPVDVTIARGLLRGEYRVADREMRPASGWPTPDLLGLLEPYIAGLEADPTLLGWGPWLLLHRADAIIVGDAGFHGPPDRLREVEIGYAVAPSYRRRGLATEAVTALLGWAFGRSVTAVVAHCEEDNAASAGVLARSGFVIAGRHGNQISWRLQRPAPDHA